MTKLQLKLKVLYHKNSTTTSPINYKTHLKEIYVKNDEKIVKVPKELTESIFALSISLICMFFFV